MHRLALPCLDRKDHEHDSRDYRKDRASHSRQISHVADDAQDRGHDQDPDVSGQTLCGMETNLILFLWNDQQQDQTSDQADSERDVRQTDQPLLLNTGLGFLPFELARGKDRADQKLTHVLFGLRYAASNRARLLQPLRKARRGGLGIRLLVSKSAHPYGMHRGSRLLCVHAPHPNDDPVDNAAQPFRSDLILLFRSVVRDLLHGAQVRP